MRSRGRAGERLKRLVRMVSFLLASKMDSASIISEAVLLDFLMREFHLTGVAIVAVFKIKKKKCNNNSYNSSPMTD